jgi:integrase
MSTRKSHGSVYAFKTKAGLRRWRAQASDEQRTSKTFQTKSEAQTWLTEFNRKEKGLTKGANKVLFKDYAQSWLESLTLAKSTIQGYEKNVRNHLVPYLGELAMASITTETIKSLYAKLRASGRKDDKDFGGALTENTLDKIHQNLRKILDLALEDGFLQSNPARQSRQVNPPSPAKIRAQKDEIQTLTAEQLAAFLDFNQKHDHLHLLWRLIALTGVRRSEAIALQWGDFNESTSRLSIRRAADPAQSRAVKGTKTNRQRNLELDPELTKAIADYKELRALLGPQYVSQNALIFGTENNELRVPNDVGARFAKAVEKAIKGLPKMQLPKFTLKTLRHTHATLLLEIGTHAKIVQERLGHSNIGVTMDIYSHVTPTMQKDAVSQLSIALNEAKPVKEN